MSASVTARPLDHVAVAVPSLEGACPLYELLSGERRTPTEVLPSQGVRVAFVGAIEILEPLAPDTSVGRFLDRRGPGLHHVAYRTENIVEDLARLEAAGIELIDRVPRPGAGGHLVAFLHPTATDGVLVELVQHLPAGHGPL
jgi:methylmalonyl-CoA/ethylmalonyl-CoA epimerase